MSEKSVFEYNYLPTMEEVHQKIIECEGIHSQTVAYSTFHDALTQICFSCKTVRSSLIILKQYDQRN